MYDNYIIINKKISELRLCFNVYNETFKLTKKTNVEVALIHMYSNLWGESSSRDMILKTYISCFLNYKLFLLYRLSFEKTNSIISKYFFENIILKRNLYKIWFKNIILISLDHTHISNFKKRDQCFQMSVFVENISSTLKFNSFF